MRGIVPVRALRDFLSGVRGQVGGTRVSSGCGWSNANRGGGGEGWLGNGDSVTKKSSVFCALRYIIYFKCLTYGTGLMALPELLVDLFLLSLFSFSVEADCFSSGATTSKTLLRCPRPKGPAVALYAAPAAAIETCVEVREY